MVGLGWQFRTLGMFTFMTLLLMLIGSIIALIVHGSWAVFLGITIGISLIFCSISYFFSKSMALKMNRARIVSDIEYPELHALVREVAEAAQLPMPEVGISDTSMPNAFATGRGPNDAAVVCTTGILELLPRDELKGVLAHEMSHIKNRDILVMSIASAMSSIISSISNMAYWMAFSNAMFNKNDENRFVTLIIAGILQILVPFAAILVQLGISRNREFLADETGARMINDPRALARALDHISSGTDLPDYESKTVVVEKRRNDPTTNYNTAHMWIANPLKGGSITGKLFSTHPPMEERIERLNKLADELGL